jgi:hypothetical protein
VGLGWLGRCAPIAAAEVGKQNRTEQNRTEQNRTEQNRTEQNRTEKNIKIVPGALHPPSLLK